MQKALAIGAAAAVVAVVGGTAAFVLTRGNADDKFAECRTSAVAGGAGQIGGPFELVDENGKTVTDQDVIQRPSLLYFGYTFCPDVCPFDTVRNADAVDILKERGYDVQPVFISIDPARDTPEVVKDFTANIHPDMLGLTGSAEQVKAASQAYRTYYKKNDAEDPEWYLMDHSTFSYLVLPQDGFVEFYRRDLSPEQMADGMQCFLDAM
ncbi:SCO family protein [Donghicola mangrovi]|uniref:SCO family protein n=1 Tax=Donghicola mangrovi TaxID=2729614 RepID=A0A850PZY8_9RHOB|nr:SCO family protein [Donghicola mangrovi]NVO22406.1 SCO family protein [Donghicola mangrovi]